MKNNIILIGMPGAGKSTVGVILAKTLGMQFIDTDLLIQQAQNKKLYEIINDKGIDEFIKIEKDIILSLNCIDTVIATGGSVVLSELSMNFLKSIGIIVYLSVSYKVIEERIKNISTRGIVLEKDLSLNDLYKQRLPLYEKYADIVISGCTNCENTVEKIVNMITS